MTDAIAQPRLCWLDTETTGLLDAHRPWDVALILRDATGFDRSYQWFIHAVDLNLATADPKALEVGRFWERHPHGPRLAEATDGDVRRFGDRDIQTYLYELPILSTRRAFSIANWVRDIVPERALILGSNPAFDQGMVGDMMRRASIDPTWHYHPIDVPTLITGWLLGNRNADLIEPIIGMKSDQLCAAIGLNLSEYVRHTALGDCELFRDAFDAIKDAR
jgi:hypothetical protein